LSLVLLSSPVTAPFARLLPKLKVSFPRLFFHSFQLGFTVEMSFFGTLLCFFLMSLATYSPHFFLSCFVFVLEFLFADDPFVYHCPPNEQSFPCNFLYCPSLYQCTWSLVIPPLPLVFFLPFRLGLMGSFFFPGAPLYHCLPRSFFKGSLPSLRAEDFFPPPLLSFPLHRPTLLLHPPPPPSHPNAVHPAPHHWTAPVRPPRPLLPNPHFPTPPSVPTCARYTTPPSPPIFSPTSTCILLRPILFPPPFPYILAPSPARPPPHFCFLPANSTLLGMSPCSGPGFFQLFLFNFLIFSLLFDCFT